ncbi:DUF6168 family protein [Polaribacter sp. SA4-12]|uniref:DUF6168 family protein n=1 Tax=Polaribacter sp. SA4-12 TaxID=1312072 RepID=UPI000B3C7B12|nr:DUF6168 family protein [Polaribacter sp. SA4-12]ARV15911.1 hypothetical protein BTO07_12495 [Polaribacter sp. SA4-12]
MVRSILVYSVVFFSLFLVCFSLHNYFLETKNIILPFSLKRVYIFHLAFSLVICVNFLIFSTKEKVFEQLGFIYLGTILLKLTLFSIIFYKSIFAEEGLPFNTRISLFIPMIIFLITEVIFVAKILKIKQ